MMAPLEKDPHEPLQIGFFFATNAGVVQATGRGGYTGHGRQREEGQSNRGTGGSGGRRIREDGARGRGNGTIRLLFPLACNRLGGFSFAGGGWCARGRHGAAARPRRPPRIDSVTLGFIHGLSDATDPRRRRGRSNPRQAGRTQGPALGRGVRHAARPRRARQPVLDGGAGAGLSPKHDALLSVRAGGRPWRQWTGLAFACLLTHVLLDCLTTYGTQVFWPFSDVPVIFGTIFIIDPLYTVPLATGLLAGLWWGPTARPRRLANGLGLALSSLYLLATIGNKLWVEHVFETSLQEQNLPHQEVFTKPTAFNNILWSGIAKAEDGFYIGFYSLLDDDTHVDVRFVPANHHLLKGAWTNPTVQELRRFSRGYFTVSRQPDGSLAVHDLRFGRSDLGLTKTGRYIFTFRLTRGPNGAVTGFTRTDPQIDARSDLIHRFVQRVRGNESAVRPSS